MWKKPELGSWLHDEFQLLALLFLVYKGTHFTNTHFSGTQISLHCFFHTLNFPPHSFFWLCFFQHYFFLSLNFRARLFRTLNFPALHFPNTIRNMLIIFLKLYLTSFAFWLQSTLLFSNSKLWKCFKSLAKNKPCEVAYGELGSLGSPFNPQNYVHLCTNPNRGL